MKFSFQRVAKSFDDSWILLNQIKILRESIKSILFVVRLPLSVFNFSLSISPCVLVCLRV